MAFLPCMALLVLTTSSAVLGDQLLMTSYVFRHGDRSSIDTFPNNTCDESCWPQGYGQLTQRGMRQHYTFGQFLRQRYRNDSPLLNSSFYIKNQMYIRSTDVDRTLMSAEAQLSAMFPPEGFQAFEPGFPWMPLPVHTIRKDNDSLLRGYDTSANACPRYTELYNAMNTLPRYKQISEDNKDFIKMIGEKSGVPYEFTLATLFRVEDPLYCQGEHNLSQPAWLTESELHKMHMLGGEAMGLMYETKEMRRLTAGVLVNELLVHMNNRSTGQALPVENVFVYSAHDTTVAALLCALDIYNGVQPPYASAVLIELWRQEGAVNGTYVKVLYRNETESNTTVPYNLTPDLPMCRGQSTCPLQVFTDYYADIRVANWYTACHHEAKSSQFNTVTIASVSIAAVFFIALFGLTLFVCRDRLRSDGYKRVDV